MTDSIDDFLTGWVLHDSKLITFRLLSRARSLHVQDAKVALQNFYEKKSKKNARALSAIYVLKGTLKEDGGSVVGFTRPAAQRSDSDGDLTMADEAGPSQSASQPKISTRSSGLQSLGEPEAIPRIQMLLVSADKLEESKARFSSLTTAHIYSLAPGSATGISGKADNGPAEDASEIARKHLPLLATVQHDLHSNKAYVQAWEKAQRGRALGVIWNPHVVEDFSPGSSSAQRTTVAGPSEQKPLAKTAVKAESKTTASKASTSKPAPSRSASNKALAASLFPETEAEPSKATDTKTAAAKAEPKAARTSSGAQKRSAPEPELVPSDEAKAKGAGSKADAVVDDGGEGRAKKRVKKTRKVMKTERSKDKNGYTVRNTVEVEEEYSTDESEDDRPKPSKVSKTSPAKAAGTASRSTSTPPPPAPAAAQSSKAQAPSKSASNPAPAKSKPSGFGANKAGSGGSGGAGTKKPTDKRQQTLGSFFKKK
ncbi:hypothetical protein V8E36_008136 [Tilletia maclaganii]